MTIIWLYYMVYMDILSGYYDFVSFQTLVILKTSILILKF